MKTRLIIATVLITLLSVYAVLSNPTTARLFIGSITITDTLTGTALFNKGIRVTEDIYAPSGIKFSSADRMVDDDGNTLVFTSGSDFRFDIGASSGKVGITATGDLTMKMTTDSLRFFDASDSVTVSNALGYIAVKVNGSTRYIPLYTTK